jgi:hypothetical protein
MFSAAGTGFATVGSDHDRTGARYCRKGDLAFPALYSLYLFWQLSTIRRDGTRGRKQRTLMPHTGRRWYCAATPAVFTCLGVIPFLTLFPCWFVPPPLSRAQVWLVLFWSFLNGERADPLHACMHAFGSRLRQNTRRTDTTTLFYYCL